MRSGRSSFRSLVVAIGTLVACGTDDATPAFPADYATSYVEVRCISCHTACGVAPDGYAGTCAVP